MRLANLQRIGLRGAILLTLLACAWVKNVSAQALTITTESLPNGVQGTPYSQPLTATGGTGTNTWTLASGSLPAGLALTTAGVINGTPTGTGPSNFTGAGDRWCRDGAEIPDDHRQRSFDDHHGLAAEWRSRHTVFANADRDRWNGY